MSHGKSRYEAAEEFIHQKLMDELPKGLSYHGVHHTLDVLNASLEIAQSTGVKASDLKILRLATLLHDIGFTVTYHGHEEAGCKIAKSILPQFQIPDDKIELICGMIMATRIPQSPDTLLERIICDADLDYLGRQDVIEIATTLFEEIKQFVRPLTLDEWNVIQVKFLEAHQYFTDHSRKYRAPSKSKYLKSIKQNGVIIE